MERREETLVPGLDDRLGLVIFDAEATKRVRESLVAGRKQPQLAALQRSGCRLKNKTDRTITWHEETSGVEMNRSEQASEQEKKASRPEKAEPTHSGLQAASRRKLSCMSRKDSTPVSNLRQHAQRRESSAHSAAELIDGTPLADAGSTAPESSPQCSRTHGSTPYQGNTWAGAEPRTQ